MIKEAISRLARGGLISAMPHTITCLEHNAGEILDKDEVPARLRDETLLPILQALIEDGQRPRNVARTNHIGQTEGHVVQTGQLQVKLVGGLRDGVAAGTGKAGMIEADWLLHRTQAVAESRLKIDKALDTKLP